MPVFVNEPEREEILAYFSGRFGIPRDSLGEYAFIKERKTIWIAAGVAGLEEALRELKIEAAGIPLLRMRVPGGKPTTAGLQLLGKRATRNAVDLDPGAFAEFLEAGAVRRSFPAEPGYVIVRWRGEVLGCGLYKPGVLLSQIPKERVRLIKR